ncbi:Hpt domain-containing protein [Pseudobacteriovorax antillogorgiicola]|uniref:Histidine kinase-, DNA gyrase B-, and HSP90-like ATPase n=1 Tax=Pseudobacteriovorax antillogorgiicola TaxID=1513793 RepID=A0A1Y6C6K8_9BACT|nr:Hpt domain-containing protein [Pseudobacteriovorax antillogorgiicola]TCS49886.1 histidine kinase/DNA gyrase B/HSP90-like ATPase [Pseudobacteriovorax antillogorgiicola]SMF44576.1 Histidine kinase-, DNA gyrase B-, and HSP90-like ATPase [Pseudobacteriovorax antillogorgiicola]
MVDYCKSLVILSLLGITGIGFSSPKAVETSGGVISLPTSFEDVAHTERVDIEVIGDWRFSDHHQTEMNWARFDRLPLKAVVHGNPDFLMFSKEPSIGSYVLAIESHEARKLALGLELVLASAEIRLVSADQGQVIYRDPLFDRFPDDPGYRQNARLTVSLLLRPGLNYLIYNYQQKPLVKRSGAYTNVGFTSFPRIATLEALRRSYDLDQMWLLIPLGIVGCLAIYSGLIYLSRGREDLDSLLLFLFNVFIFFKELASQRILSRIFDDQAFMTISGLGIGGPLVAASIAFKILKERHNTKFSNALLRLHTANTIFFILHALTLSNIRWLPMVDELTPLFVMVNAFLFFIMFVPYSIFIAVKSHSADLILFTCGILLLAAGVLSDFLNSQMHLGWPWFSMWGAVGMSLLLAKNNSTMFAQAYDRTKLLLHELELKNSQVEELNRSLERKVRERTYRLRSLLEHIPQGILSLGRGGLIEENYSLQLETILGTSKIAHESFQSVVINRIETSQDTRDQIWQTLLCSIDEPTFNFEVNEDKLPSEIDFRTPEGREKTLQVTWNIETDESEEVVDHILVTMLDISAEVEARDRLAQKDADLRIISQLIEVGADKANQFFGTGEQLLEECRSLLTQYSNKEDDLKILFINVHTLKGSARSVGFSAIAAELHQIETDFAGILRYQKTVNQLELRQRMDSILRLYEHYRDINRNVLGRENSFSKITIDRELIEEGLALLGALEGQDLPHKIVKGLRRSKEELQSLVKTPLRDTIQDAMKLSEKVARDLGKPKPRISIDCENWSIGYEDELIIRKAFVHIIRNSLDHGIEAPEERTALGKRAEGLLTVKVAKKSGQFLITFFDDGRGLDLDKLRSKLEDQALLPPDTSPEKLAESIFLPGVSTKQTVSQISGRGIGMDAIRKFLRERDGDVTIALGSAIEAGRYSFSLILTLPAESR